MHQKTTDALSRFRALIRSEQFPTGEFLPPERELCKHLQIGRSALRVICAQLEAENLLVRLPSKGMKILSPLERNTHRRLLLIFPNTYLGSGGNEIMTVLHGIAVACQEENAELVLYFTDTSKPDPQLMARIQETPWNGVLFMETALPSIITAVQAAKLNYCIVNYEESRQDIPAIRVDFREIGRMAGRLLASRGYRRLGFLGRSTFLYREELAGFKGALAEEDLSPDPELVVLIPPEMPHGKEKALLRKTIQKSMDNKPFAIFCGRDGRADALFDVCRGLGLRIPEDVAILGYDGISWDEAAQNGLSSILQPAFEVGGAAVHALFRGKGEIKFTLIPPRKLIERTSTPPLPAK